MARPVRPRLRHFGLVPALRWSHSWPPGSPNASHVWAYGPGRTPRRHRDQHLCPACACVCVRACALVPACWWDRVHACAPGQPEARPWRPIHSQLNSVPLALGSTLLRHARRTRSQSRSSLTHPSLRRSARADPPAPPTVSASASAVSERLRDCQADLTLVLWWHCSRRPSSWLRRSRWSYRAPRLTACCAFLLCAALSA